MHDTRLAQIYNEYRWKYVAIVMRRWKLTVEIQDGWRKDGEGLKIFKNTCDKF